MTSNPSRKRLFWAALLMSTAARLAAWLLLTGQLGPLNLVIGLVVALLLPRTGGSRRAGPRAQMASLGRSLAAVPQAYAEALLLMVRPHGREVFEQVPAEAGRSARLIFLEVFRITLTPLTIAMGFDREGSYRVHRLMEDHKP